MSLTANEVCLIIKACAESGVHHFVMKSDNTTVEFSRKETAREDSPVQASQPPESVESITESIAFSEGEKSPEADEEKDAIEELMISDPSRFEELLGRGELVNEETHNRGLE